MNFPSKGIPPRCVAHLSTDTRTNKTLTSEWMLESINPLLGESSSQNLSVFGHRGWSQDFNPEKEAPSLTRKAQSRNGGHLPSSRSALNIYHCRLYSNYPNPETRERPFLGGSTRAANKTSCTSLIIAGLLSCLIYRLVSDCTTRDSKSLITAAARSLVRYLSLAFSLVLHHVLHSLGEEPSRKSKLQVDSYDINRLFFYIFWPGICSMIHSPLFFFFCYVRRWGTC